MDKSQLLDQIKDAMRAKDKNRLSILRQVNQAMKQIEVEVFIKVLFKKVQKEPTIRTKTNRSRL